MKGWDLKSASDLLVLFVFLLHALLLLLTLPIGDLKLSSLVLLSILFVGLSLAPKSLDPLFCFVAANASVLFVLSASGIKYSYLSDPGFDQFYLATYFFESFFWLLFAAVVWWCGRGVDDDFPIVGLSRFDTGVLAVVASSLLALELILSRGQMFVPYAKSSDGGTILFEVGSLLISFAICMSRSTSLLSLARAFALPVGLMILIAIGLGKRLPLAYFVIAIFVRMPSFRYRKPFFYLLMLGLVSAGFVWGIFRDSFNYSAIDYEVFVGNLSSTNQGGSFHAAAVYVRTASEQLISMSERLEITFYTFFSAMIFPISILPEEAMLHSYIQKFYQIQGNGGSVGAYSYFFIGLIGPALFAFLFGLAMRPRGNSYVLQCLSCVLVITVPRWALYNLGAVTRLVVYLFAILGMVLVFSRLYAPSKGLVKRWVLKRFVIKG